MTYQTETRISGDALPETVNMADVVKRLPVESQNNFFQFWRGVNYGLDMAGGLTAHQQTEQTQTRT